MAARLMYYSFIQVPNFTLSGVLIMGQQKAHVR